MTASNSPSYQYFIAPFDHNLDTTNSGKIDYSLIKDSQTLNKIGEEISSLYYSSTVNFMPTNAFIAAWDSVPPYYLANSMASTKSGYVSYQIILTTHDLDSFLTINYGSLGFKALNGYYFQYGPSRLNISKTNPMFSSNVGVNGKWIHHLSSLHLLLIKVHLIKKIRVVNRND